MDFEITKNPTVASLDKVPEPFRGLYADAGDGSFALGENHKALAAAVDGLNGSLKAARRDADTLKRSRPDMTGFAAIGQLLGIEGEEATNPDVLKSAVEKTLSESKDGKVNWDKIRKDLETGFNAKLTAKEGEIQGMSKTLQKYLVTNVAVQAIATHKGAAELLLPHIQAQTKVIKDGEDYVVRVVDASGDPRGNSAGGFMSVDDLVKELKASPTFGRAFESEMPNGTGVKPRSTERQPVRQGVELSPTERIARGLANKGRNGR